VDQKTQVLQRWSI